MKKIIFALALLFCLAACKKNVYNIGDVKFAKITFLSAIKYRGNVTIADDNGSYQFGSFYTTVYGNKRFRFFKETGEKVLDTLLAIAGSNNYYVYQPDSTTAPILLTELPPPPPPPPAPDNPLDGSTAAPEGFIQLRMRNNSQEALPFQKLDVVLNLVTGYDPVLNRPITNPITKVALNGFEYNTDFFLFKRPEASNYYVCSFINHDTGEEIKDQKGYLYLDVFGFNLDRMPLNNYAVEINYYETTDPEESKIAIKTNGKYYIVYCDLMFQK